MPIIVSGVNELFIQEPYELPIVIGKLVLVHKAIVLIRLVQHRSEDNLDDLVEVSGGYISERIRGSHGKSKGIELFLKVKRGDD